MEVLPLLPQVIAEAQRTGEAEGLEQLRFWHSGSDTLMAKSLALIFLPVFGMIRPHNLLHYHDDGFFIIVGRSCGYSSLEHFLGELATTQMGQRWQAALARRYVSLWYDDAADGDRKRFYTDGYMKPLRSRCSLPCGHISRDGRRLPATKYLFIHGHRGHPLFASPRPGDAHLGQELMGLWDAFAAAVGPRRIEALIVDREAVSAELFARLDEEGRCFITSLRSNQYEADDFTLRGEWQDWRRDAPAEPLISQVAEASIELKAARSDLVFTARVALIKDLRQGGRLIPLVTNLKVEQEAQVTHIADLYRGHWNHQERSFREMTEGVNLRANHGYGKVRVTNRVVQRREERISAQMAAKNRQLQTAEKCLAELTARREAAQSRHEARLATLASQEAHWSTQLAEETRPTFREKLIARLGRVEAERREREAKHQARLQAIRYKEKPWQERHRQLSKERDKLQQKLQALDPEKPLYEIIYGKDTVMTTAKILLTNAHLYAREHYFSPEYTTAYYGTLDELFYQRSGWVIEKPGRIEVTLKGYRAPTIQAQAEAACQRVNARNIAMPDGRMLCMSVSELPP